MGMIVNSQTCTDVQRRNASDPGAEAGGFTHRRCGLRWLKSNDPSPIKPDARRLDYHRLGAGSIRFPIWTLHWPRPVLMKNPRTSIFIRWLVHRTRALIVVEGERSTRHRCGAGSTRVVIGRLRADAIGMMRGTALSSMSHSGPANAPDQQCRNNPANKCTAAEF